MNTLNIAVFLGYKIAYNLDDWRQAWKNDEANDYAPYGYDRAKSHHINIEYITFNNIERKLFFNKYLQFGYLYFIKLPFILLKYDIIWTHYDKDALYIAFLRSIPFINKFLAKQISCFIWLIDNSREYNEKKKKKVASLLKKINKIIFHSPTEEQKFIEIFGCNRDQLKYVPFGINIESYSPFRKNKRPQNIKDNFSNFILSIGTDVHSEI